MMMRLKISVVAVAALVIAVPSIRAQGPSLQGVWRVTEVTVTGANASTNKTPQPGLYIFTKQHYSIIGLDGTTARADFGQPKDPSHLTDAEKIARYEAWDLLIANAGTYQVSGSTLTTRPAVAKNPAVMSGPPRTREFRIQGNTLTFIEKSAAGQAAREVRTTLTRVE